MKQVDGFQPFHAQWSLQVTAIQKAVFSYMHWLKLQVSCHCLGPLWRICNYTIKISAFHCSDHYALMGWLLDTSVMLVKISRASVLTQVNNFFHSVLSRLCISSLVASYETGRGFSVRAECDWPLLTVANPARRQVIAKMQRQHF